jgi:HPt (histidine-containing phosphotransfer) domain-containing protein
VNQKVAVSQIPKPDCHADVVGNGCEALDAVESMTPRPIEGDREKCLAAGAGDSLGKPGRATQEPAIAPESMEGLRELATDANDNILTELIDTFLDNAPRILAEAADALSCRSPAALAQAAHTLGGSCSNFGAKPLQELSAQLETLARSPDFQDSPNAESRAGQLLYAIRRELERVGAALGGYRNSL